MVEIAKRRSEGIHYVFLVANNMVIQESDEERDSSEKRQKIENILEDGEVNEHEQNDYENGIEDDVVCSDDEQNVRKSENHGEQQQKEQVAEDVKQESLPTEILEMIVNLSMTAHN